MKRSSMRNMMRLTQWSLAVLALLLTLFVQTGFGQIAQQKLFLGDIDIIPPTSDLPKEIAALSGRWEGISEHGVLVVMIVKELYPDRGEIVWSFGPDLAHMTVVNESVHILPGNRPTITWNPPQEKLSLTLSEDLESLSGVSERNGAIADSGTLRKTQQFMVSPLESLLPPEFEKDWTELAQKRIVPKMLRTQSTGQAETAYLVYTPKDYETIPQQSWPLLLFLHGRGERGTDLRLLLKHGPFKLVEQGKELPFILVAPQISGNSFYFSPNVLKDVLDEVVSDYRVDQDRIYVTGLSMGGYGTWGVAMAYPHQFAAIAPIAGGNPFTFANPDRYDPDIVCQLRDLPTWAFHGAKDDIVFVEAGQQIVDDLKQCGGNVQLTIYPEAGHDSWTETYNNPEFYEWLLEHRRKAEQ